MGIYLNPSSIGFKRSLNSEIYVDKTGLIEKTNALLDTEQRRHPKFCVNLCEGVK